MAQYSATQEIEAPPLSPPPLGLLASTPVIIDHGIEDQHWLNGVSWSADACADARVLNPSCETQVQTVTRNTKRPTPGQALPFVVDVNDLCSSFGFGLNEYEARARRLLAARESKAVEKEFWTPGVVQENQRLADDRTATPFVKAAITPLGATAVGRVDAFAGIHQAIADNNLGRGMIHMRVGMFIRLQKDGLLRYEGGKYYTAWGAIVVPGSGYPGTSPSGAAASTTSEWIYATDIPQIHRGPVEIPTDDWRSMLDRTTNEVNVVAQRAYAIALNTCAVIGVNVNPTAQ